MLRSLSSRRMTPVVVLVSVALLVSGCGGKSKKTVDKPIATSTPAAGSCDYQSGSASNAIKVKGDFGKTLSTDFSTPVNASSLQRTIISKGSGDNTAKGDKLNVEYT